MARPGTSNYAGISDDPHLIDKSQLISHIIHEQSRDIMFLRPMRFGKSLQLHMVQCFFNGKEHGGWGKVVSFEDKKVWQDEEAREHYGAHPTIYINLITHKSKNMLEELDEYLCHEIMHSASSFGDSKSYADDKDTPEECLTSCADFLYEKTGNLPVLVFEEVHSFQEASSSYGSYNEVYERMERLFIHIIQNLKLYKCIFIGILPPSEDSILTKACVIDNIFNPKYEDCFGFTPDEMKAVAGDAVDIDDYVSRCGGYRIGGSYLTPSWVFAVDVNDKFKFKTDNWAKNIRSSSAMDGPLTVEGVKDVIREILERGGSQASVEKYADYTTAFSSVGTVLYYLVMAGYLTIDLSSGTLYIPNSNLCKFWKFIIDEPESLDHL